MAKVRFIPEPGTPDTHVQFGITFGPEPVEVTDAAIIAKCAGSPFYEVLDDDSGLKAVHRGRGSYSVMHGEEEVMPNLTKADADAFNALSVEDKAAYVKPAA